MENTWFLVANPTSGSGKLPKKWYEIKQTLKQKNIDFHYKFTEYAKHELEIVNDAIAQGFRNIIAVGGDGTLHNVVNGVMTQNHINPREISIGVIPVGTGNDWIKHYNIANDISEAIDVIAKQNTILHDIGYLQLADGTSEYFNNVAGIGFDGYVVTEIAKYKSIGAISYLIGALVSIIRYKLLNFAVKVDTVNYETKMLMVLFAIGDYSSGGMKLVDPSVHKEGHFMVSIVKDFTSANLLANATKLFNGEILKHKEVDTLAGKSISVTPPQDATAYIQADGELVGSGKVTATIIEKAVQFFVP